MSFNLGDDEHSPSIVIPKEWSAAADAIRDHSSSSSLQPVTIICGPKNSGKSTFSRLLVNTLLEKYKKVGYLDTDVGQPEFTAPGLLSFIVVDKPTQDYTTPCIKNPERCLFYGDVSSKRDPIMYMNSVHSLYDYYRDQYCNNDNNEVFENFEVPLVVNTPGWVKGVGYDILVDMVRYIAPTYVVKINISSQNKNLPEGKFWLNDDRDINLSLIEINSALLDSFGRSLLITKDASLRRDSKLMAYFRQCFDNYMEIGTIKELARALAVHRPYQVECSVMKINHIHCQIPASERFYSLNATIVGLAVSSHDSTSLPWCVGLGIVRCVDSAKGVLYVLTPVAPSILEHVDTILQGFIQIPTCLLQVQGFVSPYMSTRVMPTG